MNKWFAPALAGVAATVGLYLIFHLLTISGYGPDAICLGVGLITFGVIQSKSVSDALPRATPAERDAALASPPPPGYARVFVYRSTLLSKESALGGTVAFQFTLDGNKITPLPPQAFLAVLVGPGQHTLTAGVGLKQAIATFAAQAGEVLFFHLTLPGTTRLVPNLQPDTVLPTLRTLAMVANTAPSHSTLPPFPPQA